jgi:hypothetical protein
VIAEVEDRDHVGMHQARHRPGLPLEAHLLLGILGHRAQHDLEGHFAVEEGIVGVIDDAHRTLPQPSQDLVLTQAAGNLGRAVNSGLRRAFQSHGLPRRRDRPEGIWSRSRAA